MQPSDVVPAFPRVRGTRNDRWTPAICGPLLVGRQDTPDSFVPRHTLFILRAFSFQVLALCTDKGPAWRNRNMGGDVCHERSGGLQLRMGYNKRMFRFKAYI